VWKLSDGEVRCLVILSLSHSKSMKINQHKTQKDHYNSKPRQTWDEKGKIIDKASLINSTEL
jgi:hypothetical protein